MAEKQTLRMSLPLTELSAFFPLLQKGIWLPAQIGCSVMSLLTGQFGIEKSYVVERITTLFLDGRPVDDPKKSNIKDGSTVALSSAMPGLVGATMRRGGHLAAMRGAISYQGLQDDISGTGRVKIKLFNMVMAELGEIFLAHGIWLSNGELLSYLHEQEDSFWQSFGGVILGEQQIDPPSLKKLDCLGDPISEVFLTIEFVS